MCFGTCELCGRPDIEVTRHHLIPRARHRKGQTRRAFYPEELNRRVAMLCRACHRFIHGTLTERELAASYNTIPQLRSQPAIAKFIDWIATRPSGLAVRSARARR
jgi:5-methylcytosine-specific restriction endonuclease McrA